MAEEKLALVPGNSKVIVANENNDAELVTKRIHLMIVIKDTGRIRTRQNVSFDFLNKGLEPLSIKLRLSQVVFSVMSSLSARDQTVVNISRFTN